MCDQSIIALRYNSLRSCLVHMLFKQCTQLPGLQDLLAHFFNAALDCSSHKHDSQHSKEHICYVYVYLLHVQLLNLLASSFTTWHKLALSVILQHT